MKLNNKLYILILSIIILSCSNNQEEIEQNNI